MRFYQFEARSNPEKSSRATGHEQALEYLKQFSDLSNMGVRMASIPKLGLNPKSDYDTPVGICFYPADYYVRTKSEKNYKLPLHDEMKYIQIFTWGDASVLDLKSMTSELYNELLERLMKMYDPDLVWQYNEESNEEALHKKLLAGRFWYVTWMLVKKDPRKWNRLFRNLGYDVVVDNGQGIIHRNEPTQGIIFTPRVITHMEQVSSNYRTDTARHTSLASRLWDAMQYGTPMGPKLVKAIAQVPELALQYSQKILAGKRFEEGEPAIASDAKSAYSYALYVIRGPWPMGEKAMSQNPEIAFGYASLVLADRFPMGEKAIASNSDYALKYLSRYLGNKPWALCEPAMLEHPYTAFGYAKQVIKGPWPKGEPVIGSRPSIAFEYAEKILKGPFPLGEESIGLDADLSYRYASDILQGRFVKGEDVLAQDPSIALRYAIYILKSRFPKGENAIASDSETAYEYALRVIKGRWQPGESAILVRSDYTYLYSAHVLKGPWPEGEVTIARYGYQAEDYARVVLKDPDPKTWRLRYLKKMFPHTNQAFGVNLDNNPKQDSDPDGFD